MGVISSPALVFLVVSVLAAFVCADLYDGKPRPEGFDDAPSTSLGAEPAVKYNGKPADCVWYAWENFHYEPADTKNCSTMLWESLSADASRGLSGFIYYMPVDGFYDPDAGEYLCVVGCFNLKGAASGPSATPPATPSLLENSFLSPVSVAPLGNFYFPPLSSAPLLENSLLPPLPSAPPPAPPAVAIPPAPDPSPLLNPPTSIPSSTITPEAPSTSAPGPSMAPSSKMQVGLIVGICSAGLGGLLIMGLLLLFCCVKRRRKLGSASGLSLDTTSSRSYTFKELSAMTKSFSRSELLSSSGGFGEVFKGTPPSGTGKPVAVKRIRREKEHAQASFLAEASSLRQIRHRNLLQLRGWCEAREGLFLVYDYMCHGSLDKWIHQGTVDVPLPWRVRRSVLAGVAAGLEYLHEGWVQCVLHRDIKSSNVLLDADWNPYLGDFGLARLVDHEKLDKTTMPAGTLGYMAPEMHYTGKATKETDVYAFGMLVLEVVTGRRPFGGADQDFLLLDCVWRAHEAGCISKMVDARLQGSSTEEMAVLLQVGLLCCVANPRERPSIRVVGHWFQFLEAGTAELISSLLSSQPVPPPRYVSVLTTSSLDQGTSTSNTTPSSNSSCVEVTNPR